MNILPNLQPQNIKLCNYFEHSRRELKKTGISLINIHNTNSMPAASIIDFRLYSRVVYLIAIPCVLTISLSMIAAVYFEDQLPKILDVRSWQNFFFYLEKWSALEQKPQALATLMTLHALQLLCCFPLIHITKTMYGYIFGLWQGLVISFLWENTMVVVYLFTFAHCTQPANSLFLNGLIAYVHTWRSGRLFFVFLVAFHISSIPFVTKASLVVYYVVTPVEFLKSSVIASLIMSTKDTLFGDYIAHSDYSASKLGLYSVFLCFSTLLPTALTVLIMTGIFRFTARNLSIPTNAADELVDDVEELLGRGNEDDTLQNTEHPCSTHSSTCTEIMSTCLQLEDARSPRDPETCAREDIELATVSPPVPPIPPIPPPRRVVSVHAAALARSLPDCEISSCGSLFSAGVGAHEAPSLYPAETCARGDIELATVPPPVPPIPPARSVVSGHAATLADAAESRV